MHIVGGKEGERGGEGGGKEGGREGRKGSGEEWEAGRGAHTTVARPSSSSNQPMEADGGLWTNQAHARARARAREQANTNNEYRSVVDELETQQQQQRQNGVTAHDGVCAVLLLWSSSPSQRAWARSPRAATANRR